jgi:aryl-alcohol dehydrogenase-like predicted oxidoreductase
VRSTRFGQTDLEVSRICFGTWQVGGDWGAPEERELEEAMRRALELGINFFDTAQAYGFGASEKLLGKEGA